MRLFKKRKKSGKMKIEKRSDETKKINTFTDVVIKNIQKYHGPFSKIIKYSPDFFELFQSLLKEQDLDENVSSMVKAVIAYFVLPQDIIPEDKFGAFGYIDDLYLCAHVISTLIAERDVIKKHWAKKEDVFRLAAYIKKEIENAPENIIRKEELEEIRKYIEPKFGRYKLLQNRISPYLIVHLVEKIEFNVNVLSSRERNDFHNLSDLKMRGVKLSQEQETYLGNILFKVIDEGIIEAECKDEPCFSCEKLRKIKKLLMAS